MVCRAHVIRFRWCESRADSSAMGKSYGFEGIVRIQQHEQQSAQPVPVCEADCFHGRFTR